MAEQDHPRIFIPPPLIIVGTLVAGLAIDGRLTGHADFWLPIALAGGLIALAGAAVIVVALGLFGAANTRAEPWKPASTLVSRGIYNNTRNPMYLGMLLAYVGGALGFRSVTACLLLIPLVIVFDRVIVAREEAYLTRRFGASYDEYRLRVPRWF